MEEISSLETADASWMAVYFSVLSASTTKKSQRTGITLPYFACTRPTSCGYPAYALSKL
ncbi:hypothetical protein Neosp_014813 [[Neocosmospora] mangrovei]